MSLHTQKNSTRFSEPTNRRRPSSACTRRFRGGKCGGEQNSKASVRRGLTLKIQAQAPKLEVLLRNPPRRDTHRRAWGHSEPQPCPCKRWVHACVCIRSGRLWLRIRRGHCAGRGPHFKPTVCAFYYPGWCRRAQPELRERHAHAIHTRLFRAMRPPILRRLLSLRRISRHSPGVLPRNLHNTIRPCHS